MYLLIFGHRSAEMLYVSGWQGAVVGPKRDKVWICGDRVTQLKIVRLKAGGGDKGDGNQ